MFTQHAEGNFTLAVGGGYHCGEAQFQQDLHFNVVIHYPDWALDAHGFLIDNLEFRRYFESIKFTEDSCELLAKKAADHFCDIAPHAIDVHVDIAVPGLADIEYEETPIRSRRPAAAAAASFDIGDL